MELELKHQKIKNKTEVSPAGSIIDYKVLNLTDAEAVISKN